VNKCTYEEAVKKAKECLEMFDAEREFKQLDLIYGLTPETRESRRKANQELIDGGYGELSLRGDAVIMSGDKFVKYFNKKD